MAKTNIPWKKFKPAISNTVDTIKSVTTGSVRQLASKAQYSSGMTANRFLPP